MPDLPAVIQETGPALRRRLSWAEACTYAQLADSSPRDLRRILGGLPVARDVEEKIDGTGDAGRQADLRGHVPPDGRGTRARSARRRH
jgi:hypothetical protein